MIVLDSDVVSGWMRHDEAVLDWLESRPRASFWTSAVTLFEVRFAIESLPSGRRRGELEERLRWTLEVLQGRILPFDAAAAEAGALLRARRHRRGQVIEMRDTQIAGIALSRRASIATRNTRHFADLDVPVLDPWAG